MTLFNKHQLFAVYEKEDIQEFIKKLEVALCQLNRKI